MDTSSVPRKQCSNKANCIHPDSSDGWLPATGDYFSKNKGGKYGLKSTCKVCVAAYGRRHYYDPHVHDKRTEQIKDYARSERGKEIARKREKNYQDRYPERYAAKLAVMTATHRGKMPRASDLLCAHCGNPATEYHHHRGYQREYWLDVIPLCTSCHKIVHRG